MLEQRAAAAIRISDPNCDDRADECAGSVDVGINRRPQRELACGLHLMWILPSALGKLAAATRGRDQATAARTIELSARPWKVAELRTSMVSASK